MEWQEYLKDFKNILPCKLKLSLKIMQSYDAILMPYPRKDIGQCQGSGLAYEKLIPMHKCTCRVHRYLVQSEQTLISSVSH
jgi:hypothetical protein